MPNKIRFCLLCNRYDRTSRSNYTRIYTAEREAKLFEGYRRRNNGQELNKSMLNQIVHQKCYNKIVQGVSTNEESNDILLSTEPKQEEEEEEEEQPQSSLIQFRSRMPLPTNVNKRRLFERRQRVCAVCNRYGYRSDNKMKQIVSNFMANQLAEGYSHIYKKPIGKSLLDAYIHALCFRKLYSTYRYHAAKKSLNTNRSPQRFINRSLYTPHQTRSRSSLNHSSSSVAEIRQLKPKITTDETTNLSIEQLFSAPFLTSVATTNPNVELSARSCLFRPCLQRLTSEEIELYTKRNSVLEKSNEENALMTDQLPDVQSSITQPLPENDSMIYSNQDDDDNDLYINEQDRSPDWRPKYLPPPRLMFNKQFKVYTAAKIRRRYLKPPPLAKPTNPLISDHTYISKTNLKAPIDIENLYNWLTEELKFPGNPLSMGEVLTKYRELTDEQNVKTTRESICRERLKHRLEKFYPNQFIFITPNKREGTYIALNNIDHYVRLAIKHTKQEKEKATEASMVSSIIAPPAPVIDYKRQTCEAIMNGIRKIRLYIRDPKQINSLPSLLIRNTVGLITTSERQYDKISQQYDFYRMIDDDLFNTKSLSNKFDKNLRNMSLASDLISARHDNRISEKHFLLADELTKKSFHCTPKQVITLLNHYGHTCSYKSYMRMKTLRQRTTGEFGEEIINELETIIANDEKSSDEELDLMEL